MQDIVADIRLFSAADSSVNFYRNLPMLTTFIEATEGRLHVDVPGDWWVVVADIINSTQAIEAGAYKKVNTVGVACIAAVVNVDRSIDLPFVFGGDGVTCAIPDVMRERAVSALRGAQRLARESFGLELRVGLVQVSELVEQGFWVRLAKVRLSPNTTQTALSGRGWEEVERRVKNRSAMGVLRVQEGDGPENVNFEGFECRWQGVPSFRDHKLSLLVAAISSDAEANRILYRQVLDQIQSIYGDVRSHHPLRASHLRLTFNPRLLLNEWRVSLPGTSFWSRLTHWLQLLFKILAGRILFAFNLDTAAVRWSRYGDELVDNAEFRKFDGMLRMVIDGSDRQAEQLRSYLESEFCNGRLVYGMHQSPEALVTCIIQSYNGNHLHFVDGSDGGYTLAARELKRRLFVSQAGKN